MMSLTAAMMKFSESYRNKDSCFIYRTPCCIAFLVPIWLMIVQSPMLCCHVAYKTAAMIPEIVTPLTERKRFFLNIWSKSLLFGEMSLHNVQLPRGRCPPLMAPSGVAFSYFPEAVFNPHIFSLCTIPCWSLSSPVSSISPFSFPLSSSASPSCQATQIWIHGVAPSPASWFNLGWRK